MITLTVFKMGEEYASTRSFDNNVQLHPGTFVFSITKKMKDGGNLDDLHNEAKGKARELGIKKVINLDPD